MNGYKVDPLTNRPLGIERLDQQTELYFTNFVTAKMTEKALEGRVGVIPAPSEN